MILTAILLVQLAPWFIEVNLRSGPGKEYQWVQISPSGSGKEEHEWTTGTWPRLYLPPVVRGDTLFLFGERFTFTTVDGRTWQRRRHTGGWGERYGAAHVAFNNKFWILGGMKTWDKFENDIWVSNDGYQWRLVTEDAPWSERRGHSVFHHLGALWLVGGAESSGKHDVLPTHSLGDAWRSENGSTWQRVTQTAPWAAEFSRIFFNSDASAHSFLDRLWVFGGPGNNLWQSDEGQSWKRISNAPGLPARLAGKTIIFDEKFWLFGGSGRNDVWSSPNGVAWTHLGNAPWSERAPGQSVVFLQRLWVFGGKTGRSNDPGDDVWTLQRRTTAP